MLPVPPECLDRRVCPVNEVLTAIVDPKEHLVRPAYLDHPAQLANKDPLDHAVLLDFLDFLERLANRTRKETCVKFARQC